MDRPMSVPTTEDEYRTYFYENYCRRPIRMPLNDGTTIPVFFKPDDFDHAFFESSQRDGVKDSFSQARSGHMDAIARILQDAGATRLQGWDKARGRHDPGRCVTVVLDDEFVIIIRLRLTQQATLKANFVTCFVADNSFAKIAKAPAWNTTDCLAALRAR